MDDKKPRRAWWTATQRDAVSDKARRERARSSSDQVDRLADAIGTSTGVVRQKNNDDPDTGRTETIDASPELSLLFQRDDNTREGMIKLVDDAREDAANRILKAMGDKPPAEQMSSLEKTIRRLRAVIIAVAIPAASSFVLVGRYIYARGAEDERTRIELTQTHERLDAVAKELEQLRELTQRTATRLDDLLARPR